jgi:hypothetical protein
MQRWIKLDEIAAMFDLSEDSILRIAKTHGLPLKRITPFATPGCLQTHLFKWIEQQPRAGRAVRGDRRAKAKSS